MKTFVALIACAGTLMTLTGAGAFDVRSPSPDWELREESQRRHVSAGAREARASAPRRAVRTAPIRQGSPAAISPRERDLRGHDW